VTRHALAWTLVPLVAAVCVISQFWHAPWTSSKVVGLILTAVGFGLVSVARFQLGPSFSITPQARALVTKGIYSVVRHPVYVFSLIGVAGLVLYIQRPVFLWLLVPVALMQIVRARAEERVLTEKFGDDYRRYRARTWL
jgi:protein-S-isoprenylcysteine O-methyltransferase Ste14